jgi:RNA polymerase sigma-70 factor, ECF subfamily
VGSDATEGGLRFAAMRRQIDTSDGAHSLAGHAAPLDEELLLRIRGGDDHALGLLFERYSRLVLAVGYRVLRDRTEAEELVQDAFLYVREKAGLFDPKKGKAKSWLMQVA